MSAPIRGAKEKTNAKIKRGAPCLAKAKEKTKTKATDGAANEAVREHPLQ
jgi:hypothetical protein